RWEVPDASRELSDEDVVAIQEKVMDGEWREDVRAKNWVGKAVAEVMNFDLDEPQAKASTIKIVASLMQIGALVTFTLKDAHSKPRKFVRPGKKWESEKWDLM